MRDTVFSVIFEADGTILNYEHSSLRGGKQERQYPGHVASGSVQLITDAVPSKAELVSKTQGHDRKQIGDAMPGVGTRAPTDSV